jgi:abhydrolase domain-containing protein 6
LASRLPAGARDRRPTVLCIHGQPGDGDDWRAIRSRLEDSYRVLTPDRPGWGDNPDPARSLDANADVLASLLSRDEPAVVLGHSLGGGIALLLALNYPDRVAALVLASPVGVREALGGTDRILAIPILGGGVLRAGGVALRRGALVARRLADGRRTAGVMVTAARSAALRSVMAEGGRPITPRDRRSFLIEQRALIRETPGIEARLPSLRVPTVILHGTADHIVPPLAARRLAGLVPGAELVLMRGAGHRLAFEQPESIVRAIDRYAQLSSRATVELRDELPPPALPGI